MESICRVCSIKQAEFQRKWTDETLCGDCKCTVLPVAVKCDFKDGTGKGQTLSFDFDLIMGVYEKMQLKNISLSILKEKGFLNTKAHKISYQILNNTI